MPAQRRPRLGVLPLAFWSMGQLFGCDEPPAPPDPGRVTLHRLNRDEYNHTVRDLLGTSQRPACLLYTSDAADE